MTIRKKDIEIMAPVGSYESLMAAIQGGANSIYFGIEQLNMRSKSSNNFTTEDLKKIVEICNKHNVKTYLTVNTIIYDKDISLMKQIVDAAKSNGVSAIIASDMAVINYAFAQGVEIHASTQLNVSNTEALKFFARFCDVIVTARELSLMQVKEISKNIEEENICGPSGKLVRIEVFAHGALCMAVSGKCYLSLHEQNSSANRGSCRQTCRKAYTVTEKNSGYQLEIDNEYIMSPKDLCTVGFIDKIIDAGITVLKIEGRARAPEYVKTVTQVYREAANAYNNGNYTSEKIKSWEEKLSSVFNRGFWDGYYLGRKIGEWSRQYGSQATKRKKYIGKGMNYFKKIKVAEFHIEAGELNIGDNILITGPTTGVIEHKIEEMRVDMKITGHAEKGVRVSIPIPEKIRPSDKLYKVVETTNDLLQ
ncbi:MAG: peptidase U32 family protein [Bacteroidota bacterium]|nr:peptidase U32 family protein [Bacteroidota bacterium]